MNTNSIFISVLIGTILLGIAGGMVGTVTVLGQKSLIGDAIGHSSFPGIVLAFMLMSTRSPYVLLSGAVATGLLAYLIISLIDHKEKQTSDTSLAIVLSGFFGLGMALKSYIQGNVAFQGASQSGLQSYIFGQAAFMSGQDIVLIFAVSLLAIAMMMLFHKEIKLFVFDRDYLEAIGFHSRAINLVIIITAIAIIAAGLKVVGSILISSIMIAPTVAALQWTDRYEKVLLLSTVFGGVSAAVGTIWSGRSNGIATGPAIVVVMSSIALLSMIFGTNGVLKVMRRRRVLRGESK